jgi:hypothetical protein
MKLQVGFAHRAYPCFLIVILLHVHDIFECIFTTDNSFHFLLLTDFLPSRDKRVSSVEAATIDGCVTIKRKHFLDNQTF